MEGGIPETIEKKPAGNKRAKKAAAKKAEKDILLPRDDVEIPDLVEGLES